jgi:hypothetical protein
VTRGWHIAVSWIPVSGIRRASAQTFLSGAVRKLAEQRLRFGDLGHLRRRRKAFERGGENGVGLSEAAGRLIELRQLQRRLQAKLRLHTYEIAAYGGLVQRMPLYALAFMVFTLANIGLPGTTGFIGEFLTLIGTFQINNWVAFLATFGTILSGIVTSSK